MDSALGVTHAPSGTQWTIASGGQEAVVVEVGGGLRSFGDFVDGYADHELCPGSAGQLLAPWPNRIRDGRYSWQGTGHQLPLTEPARHTALHGLVNWARWRCVEQTTDSVTLEHELVPQPGYPWPLHLRTTWTVGGDGLVATHEATNVGSAPAPFGFSVHPYLFVPGVALDDLSLHLPAQSRLLVDGRLLPIGAARVAGTEYDFTSPRRIGGTQLDTAFGDVDRDADGGSAARLTGPDGRGVELWADHRFGWWQVYTSDTLTGDRLRRSVAVEPMTCPPDAFRSGRDVITLEPGGTWTGTWGIRGIS